MFAPFVSPATAAYLIQQSLRFNDDDSAYLYRTPSVAGNRKTWTFSCWTKRGNITTPKSIFAAGNGTNSDGIWWNTTPDNNLTFLANGGNDIFLESNASFRDPSAWYHIVVAVDTTQVTSSDRVKIWVNGVQITSWATSTYPTQNYDCLYLNNTVQHAVGYDPRWNYYYDGLIALPILVDGAALDYTSFAQFNGIWYSPKRFTPTTVEANLTPNFEASYTNSTTQTAYTFSSADIGTASANRKVIVAASGAGDTGDEVINSVTLGGTAMNVVVSNDSAGGGRPAGIYELDVSSGTTADIVVTFDSSCSEAGIGIWTIEGGNVFDTGTSTADPGTASVNVPDGGAIVAFYTSATGASSFSWTNLTEDFDEEQRTSFQYQTGASKSYSSYTTESISVNAAAGTQFNLVAASFQPSGGYGVNGFVLDFADTGAYGDDESGNTNDFTASGLAANDQLVDTPTDKAATDIGNYPTLNPLHVDGTPTFANGNLTGTPSSDDNIQATIALPTSGKWYWETTKDDTNTGLVVGAGIIGSTGRIQDNGGVGYREDGETYENGVRTGTGGTTFSNGNVVQVAYDADAAKIWIGINNTWLGSGDPAAGTNELSSGTTNLPPGQLIPQWDDGTGASGNPQFTVNFGQSNFTYTPPTGFEALATQNIPAPIISNPGEHFNTVLYTGNGTAIGSGGNEITGVGFQPDLVWIKNRDQADGHRLFDAVSGATKYWQSDSNVNQTTDTESLSTFDSDGFTLGNEVGVNTNTEDYVAWCWKANGAGSSNSDGSITTTVSANTTAGFSIVTWTGSESAGDTIGHGLGAAPDFVIIKNISAGSNNEEGEVYHSALGASYALELPNTNSQQSSQWNSTEPTSTVMTLGAGERVNHDTLIGYFWTEIEGYSKFGSFVGNAAADGPFIYTGFKPVFVILKNASATGDWVMHDNKRSPYNQIQDTLRVNSNAAEQDGEYVDFLSNGFKVRQNSTRHNGSGNTIVYAAFAETPFQGSNDNLTQGRAA